jgi:uncharacterized protein YcfL
MRLLTILIALVLVGCATRQPTLTYDQIAAIQVRDTDCKDVDQITNIVEAQLRTKGLLGRNPEDMSQADREYNSRARVIIWSLRISCNNPGWIKL